MFRSTSTECPENEKDGNAKFIQAKKYQYMILNFYICNVLNFHRSLKFQAATVLSKNFPLLNLISNQFALNKRTSFYVKLIYKK